MFTFAVLYRGVEQLVARRAHNPEVGGSSPPPATKQDNSFGLSLFFIPIPLIERTAKPILGGSRNSVGITIQLSDSEQEKLFVHDSMQVSPE